MENVEQQETELQDDYVTLAEAAAIMKCSEDDILATIPFEDQEWACDNLRGGFFRGTFIVTAAHLDDVNNFNPQACEDEEDIKCTEACRKYNIDSWREEIRKREDKED